MASSKLLEHSIFQWDINNFKFCLIDPSYFFVSPVFDLIQSSSKWYLELYVSQIGNMKLHLSLRLRRAVTDEGPEEIKARFSLTLLATDGTTLWEAHNQLCNFKFASTCGTEFETDIELITFLLRNNDVLIVICQIFATTDSLEMFPFDSKTPDLKTLSDDLSQLMFRNDIPKNATLLSDDEDIPVHKEILCARSPVFKKLFAKGVGKIQIPYSKEVVLAMLTFLYSGNTDMMAFSNPPPIDLYYLSHHYKILHLQSVLCPQEFIASTTIEASDYSYVWNIPSITSALTNIKVSDTGIWEFENVQIKLSLFCDAKNKQGNFKFVVQLWNLMEVFSFSIGMYILDVFGNRRISHSALRSPTKSGTDTICFFIPEERIFSRQHVILPHDFLTTEFYFNFRLLHHGELSSLPVQTSVCSDMNGTFASHSLSYQLKDLFLRHVLTDANIQVCGVNIRVHKSILSARSPVFKHIFENLLDQTYQVEGLSISVVEQLLYYIYTGHIYTADTLQLIELYDAADQFAVPQLKETCYKLLSKCRITALNVCSLLLRFSDKQDFQYLKTRCQDYICRNVDIVFDKPSWTALKYENSRLYAEVMDLIMNKSRPCQSQENE